MWDTLRNAWRIKDIRKKITFTLIMLLIYRVGSFIPVPFVDSSFIKQLVGENNLLGLLDIISGGAFGNYTIFAMGITPYINSSIIMQLLTVAIPKLEQLSKEGEEGQKKIAQYTRYLTIVLAFVQSAGITYGLANQAMTNRTFWGFFVVSLTLTAGTAFLMWLGEQITEKGIGNGISMIIFASIVSRIPIAVVSLWNMAFVGQVMSPWALPLILVFVLALITGVVFIDMGQRRIPVQYAKRVVGRKVYGGQSTHIPIKVNSSGVLPIIFAVSILSLPQTIGFFFPESGFYSFVEKYFSQQSAAYAIVYALLIVFFTFFYTQISFNPIEVANNLRQYGGFVQGIRPGKPTSDYLLRISNRITLVGSLFLAAVAIIPIIVAGITSIPMYLQGTSILILVSVSLETSQQLEAQMLMRHYKGFLK
ncbi:MAG: preprotein translocase subunit SecY [Clostridiales bacterium]|nr:preprotein translocase subunit SecY [Clostridiales bacterium]